MRRHYPAHAGMLIQVSSLEELTKKVLHCNGMKFQDFPNLCGRSTFLIADELHHCNLIRLEYVRCRRVDVSGRTVILFYSAPSETFLKRSILLLKLFVLFVESCVLLLKRLDLSLHLFVLNVQTEQLSLLLSRN